MTEKRAGKRARVLCFLLSFLLCASAVSCAGDDPDPTRLRRAAEAVVSSLAVVPRGVLYASDDGALLPDGFPDRMFGDGEHWQLDTCDAFCAYLSFGSFSLCVFRCRSERDVADVESLFSHRLSNVTGEFPQAVGVIGSHGNDVYLIICDPAEVGDTSETLAARLRTAL